MSYPYVRAKSDNSLSFWRGERLQSLKALSLSSCKSS